MGALYVYKFAVGKVPGPSLPEMPLELLWMKNAATTFAVFERAVAVALQKQSAETLREKYACKAALRKLGSKFPEEAAEIYKEEFPPGQGLQGAAAWKKACLKAVAGEAAALADAAEKAFQKHGARASREKTVVWRTWANKVADKGGAAAHRATKFKARWAEDIRYSGLPAAGAQEVKALELEWFEIWCVGAALDPLEWPEDMGPELPEIGSKLFKKHAKVSRQTRAWGNLVGDRCP